MATLSKNDLLKRENITNFAKRVNGGGSFKLMNESSAPAKCTGKFKLNSEQPQTKLDESWLRSWCTRSGTADKLFIEVKEASGQIRYKNLTELFKDKDMGGVAAKAGGAGTERQENGLINAINEGVMQNGHVTISSFKDGALQVKIKSAKKNTGMSALGKEPYIDVIIEGEGKKYGISCKGTSAPSLAGGGIAGLKVATPDLMPKFYNVVQMYMKNTLKMKEGDVTDISAVPDIFVEIPQSYVRTILEGTKRMGGPISHMYVGPMDVTSSIRGNALTISGQFYSIDEYMRKVGKFYFRLRKRDVDSEPKGRMIIEYANTNREGFPRLFTGQERKKNLSRLVITDSVPSNAVSLKIT